MNKNLKTLLLLLFPLLPVLGCGQGYVSTDYLSASPLRDKDGNKYGSGSLMTISGRYTLPISAKQNDKGQVTAWTATLNCTYGVFNNKGAAQTLSPDNILNSSLHISHIRPISEKWSMITSLGCGVYAAPNEITFKSILANGAAIFVYKLNDNLHIGIGAGLTNSYGVPVILPMGYLSWLNSGKYEISVDMSSGMKISASTWFTKKVRIELVALDMDGMSAVMNTDGKTKIYSTVMIRSYISPSFYFSRRTSVYLGIGGNWMRSVSISDRSFKGFFNNFSNNDNQPNLFSTALRLTVGFRYNF